MPEKNRQAAYPETIEDYLCEAMLGLSLGEQPILTRDGLKKLSDSRKPDTRAAARRALAIIESVNPSRQSQ